MSLSRHTVEGARMRALAAPYSLKLHTSINKKVCLLLCGRREVLDVQGGAARGAPLSSARPETRGVSSRGPIKIIKSNKIKRQATKQL